MKCLTYQLVTSLKLQNFHRRRKELKDKIVNIDNEILADRNGESKYNRMQKELELLKKE